MATLIATYVGWYFFCYFFWLGKIFIYTNKSIMKIKTEIIKIHTISFFPDKAHFQSWTIHVLNVGLTSLKAN